MAKVYVNQTGSRSVWADLLAVTPSPSPADLCRAFRGIAGACAQLNSQAVSDTPCALYRGDTLDDPEVADHPFLTTLHKPNPYMGQKLLWRMTQLYLELTGRAYWHIIPGVLNPCVEIYPLQSHLVSPIYGSDNQLAAWQYDKVTLQLDEVVQFFFPDPLNPYGSGKGPMELAWSEVVLMNTDTAMMTALMKNGGAPSHIMSPKDQQGVVSTTVLNRLQAAWNTFRGRGANRLMIPEIPVDIQSLAQTSKEFEGSARFKDLQSVVLACFNIPSALFSSAGSRAELDAALVQHARLAIDPRTTLLEDVINRRIVSLYGDDLSLLFEENLTEDSDATDAGSANADPAGLPTLPNPSSETQMNTEETDDAK